MAVEAVAREAARAASMADTVADARARGLARGREVAGGYGLADGSLDVRIEPGAFRRGGAVRGSVRGGVALDDLPLLSRVHVTVSGEHVELIDAYRSRWRGERNR
jgi:hypothetical protein